MPSKTQNTPFGCTISCDPRLKVIRIYADSLLLNSGSHSHFSEWKVEVWVSRQDTWKKLLGNTRGKLSLLNWLSVIELVARHSIPTPLSRSVKRSLRWG